MLSAALPPLSAESRRFLAALADVLVPSAHGMPSAGEVNLALPGGRIDRVLSLRADLAAGLPEALAIWRGEATVSAVDTFEAREPDAFFIILEVVLAAYYLDPEVKKRLGYEGQQALTLPRSGIGGEDHLAAMMESPPRYRQPAQDLRGARR